MFIITLVLLFIIKLRFPKTISIATLIEGRYGRQVLLIFRKCENLQWKQKKIEADKNFLVKCKLHRVIPNFLKFRLSKQKLGDPNLVRNFQNRLLEKEIKIKNGELNKVNLDYIDAFSDLKNNVRMIDYVCLKSKISTNTDKLMVRQNAVHERKLFNLGIQCNHLDPNNVVFNFSSKELSHNEKLVLSRGLDFSLPLKKLNYVNHFCSFESLYDKMSNINIYNSNQDPNPSNIVCSTIKAVAFESYYNYDPRKLNSALSKDDFNVLTNLATNQDIVITKPDKGNGVVILDKNDYLAKMQTTLSDRTKFKIIDKDLFKLIIKLEDHYNRILSTLKKKDVINDTTYNELYVRGSQPGVMYGLPKVHKVGIPLRPILSAIDTVNYRLAKFLVPILKPLTTNEYTVADSFNFAKEISKKPNSDNFIMASFDVVSLFTNIPLQETIDICIASLFKNENDLIIGLNRNQLKSLLDFAVKENVFIFDNIVYQQIDGVAMGSPLGPTLANIFLSYHEQRWMHECPSEFKPTYYRRYVDDTFLLFKTQNQIDHFLNYLNSMHESIKFTSEVEKEKSLAYIGLTIERTENKFSTSVYQKPTYTGLGMKFDSFLPINYKRNLILCLVDRAYHICSTYKKFTSQLDVLKLFFVQNYFPVGFVEKNFRHVINKFYSNSEKVTTVPKRVVYFKIPFMGNNAICKKLRHLFTKFYPQVNLRIIYTKPSTIGSFFRFKDRIPSHLCSNIVYKFTCGSCQATYIGKSIRHQYTRIYEHKGLSWRTGQPLSSPMLSCIRDHAERMNHPIDSSNFKIIAKCQNSNLQIKESIFIYKEKPALNINASSFNLKIIK